MSLLKNFNPSTMGEGILSRPPDDRRLEGNPEFTTWPHQEEPAQVGVWAATPGLHVMERDGTTWETFHILEGEIEITEEGKAPKRFTAGDVVVVEPNFRGTWRTIMPVKKIYITVQV